MITFERKHPQATVEMLGYIPGFLSDRDPRPAREQLDTGYRHGGGWDPFPEFTMTDRGDLVYPGDPVVRLLWEAKLREELIRVYEYAWVAVVQTDGSYEVSRMD